MRKMMHRQLLRGMYAGGSNKYGHANKEDISVKVDVTGRISGQDIVLASDKYLKNKAR